MKRRVILRSFAGCQLFHLFSSLFILFLFSSLKLTTGSLIAIMRYEGANCLCCKHGEYSEPLRFDQFLCPVDQSETSSVIHVE